MITINISGFKIGDSPMISVDQDGTTAGPYQPPAWGQPNTGGTITIEVDRTTLQCAPDSVRFSVDLSAATFDTPAPTGGNLYDARLHDLIYLWDFDDAAAGNWSAPVNVLAAWKNRNVAKGPWVAHMYTQPGTYNPSVLVIEPSSGKTATASVEVIVANPDTVYAGTQTVCVNPVGDTDFAGKPTGALEVYADSLIDANADWIANGGTTARRWLFKRGETYSMRVGINGRRNIHFGSYGSGANPTINQIPGLGEYTIEHHGGYNASVSGDPCDLRISDLDFVGTYDPTTQTIGWAGWDDTNSTESAYFGLDAVDVMISNCLFSGQRITPLSHQSSYSPGQWNFHIDDSVMTSFGGQYQVFAGGAAATPKCSVSVTGCRIAQTQTGIDEGGQKSIIRAEYAPRIYVAGLDTYMTNDEHPHYSVPKTPRADGGIVNVHSCAMEGGSTGVSVNGNKTAGLGRTTVANAIIDGTVWVPNFGGIFSFETFSTGVTVRNNLVIMPAVDRATAGGFRHFVYIGPCENEASAEVLAAPIRIYNNTLVMLRTTAQQNLTASESNGYGSPPVFWNGTVGTAYEITDVTEANNVRHMPALNSPVTTYAPFETDVLWTPRNIGRRDPITFSFNTGLLTPTDVVKSYRPAAGSTAIGTALTGDVAYMDLGLDTRPDPPSKGAWEVA